MWDICDNPGACRRLKQIVAQKLSPTLSPKEGDKGGAPQVQG